MYLDTASATPTTPRAQRAFIRALKVFGNPQAPHRQGQEAERLLSEARTHIARICSVSPEAVIFTGNATEANNIAILGSVYKAHEEGRELKEVHVMYVKGAHASTREAMNHLAYLGVRVDEIPYTNKGGIDIEYIKNHLSDQTVLVSVEQTHSETGVEVKTRDIRRVLDAGGSTVYLHVDASQSGYVSSLDRSRLGADLLTFDAQKIGGVRGIGALVTTSRVSLAPIVFGGGQERSIRPGTPSVALACAFAVALADAQKDYETFRARALHTRNRMKESICANIQNVEINEGALQAPHILNLSLMGRDTDYLVALLDARGFSVSTKSACESDSEEGARGVYALTHDNARAAHTLRISWNPDTKERDLMALVQALIAEVAFLDRHKLS